MIDAARLRHLAGALTDIAGELLQMADQAEGPIAADMATLDHGGDHGNQHTGGKPSIDGLATTDTQAAEIMKVSVGAELVTMMNGGDRRSADFSRSKDRLKISTATTAEMLGVGEAQATDPRSWYQARVAHLVAQGRTSSRQQDYVEAMASGLCLTRDEVRALRAELAPADWTRPGRPRLVGAA